MIVIPLQATPSQTLNIMLGGQNCAIALYQKGINLLFDLTVNGTPVMQAQACRNRVLLVRQPYLGFVGDLAVIDLEGANDPDYTQLGTRYVLVYFAPSELS